MTGLSLPFWNADSLENNGKPEAAGPVPKEDVPATSITKDNTQRNVEAEINPLCPSDSGTDKTLSSLSSSATLTEKSDKALIAKPTENGKSIAKTTTSQASAKTPKEQKKNKTEKIRGWPDRPPFSLVEKNNDAELLKKYIFWSDLTWREKFVYRKEFLCQYLSETRKCFPHVRRLFLVIYRISPWRAMVILVLNIVNSFLPALNLKTRGSFILMVFFILNTLMCSCNEGLRKENSIRKPWSSSWYSNLRLRPLTKSMTR